MIVSLHIATGAVAGALVRSRPFALLLGPVVHVAADRVPHDDVHDLRFEVGSGLAVLALLAVRCGLLDPVVLGGAAAAAPDLEHVLPWLRPRGRNIFHRDAKAHGGISTSAQLLLAGAIIAFVLGRRRA